MFSYLNKLFHFERLASINTNNRAHILKALGVIMILTSFLFSLLHFSYGDQNGALFLLSIALLGIFVIKLTPFLGHAISSHLYSSIMALTIFYFYISLDYAMAAWLPLIPVAGLLSHGWRAGFTWLVITLVITTLLFLFPIDKTHTFVGLWADVPPAYQTLDAFIVAIGAVIIITLLMQYVEMARILAFNHLEEHKQNLEEQVKQEVERRLAETSAYEQEIELAQKELIVTMGTLLETRSNETGNHVQRVCEYSALLAKLLGLDNKEQDLIFIAASMHDIGKVAIADNILHKPGKLSPSEYDTMQQHAEIGYQILKSSKRPIIQTAAEIARYHHEWWNGEGYPKQLKGEEIPLYARIVAIADVFDALGSERAYKQHWPLDDVFEYLKSGSGKQFDPKLIDLVVNNAESFLKIRNQRFD